MRVPDEYFHQDDVALTQNEVSAVIGQIEEAEDLAREEQHKSMNVFETYKKLGRREGLELAKEIINGWSQ